jgi:hypothetical protein
VVNKTFAERKRRGEFTGRYGPHHSKHKQEQPTLFETTGEKSE